MTTLTIVDVPKSTFSKTTYRAEELLKILLQKLDYDVKLDFFSKEENEQLLSSSNWKHDLISKLID